MNSIRNILSGAAIISLLALFLLDPLFRRPILATPYILLSFAYNFLNSISNGIDTCFGDPKGIVQGIYLFGGEGELPLELYYKCMEDSCCKLVLISSSSLYLISVLFIPFIILLTFWKLFKDFLKKQ